MDLSSILNAIVDWAAAHKMWLLAIGGPIVIIAIVLKMVNPD